MVRRDPGALLRGLPVLVLLVSGCSDLRVKEGIYTNLEDAKASGAVQAGWVPAALPANAADLREGHLPDGRQWGVFTFAQWLCVALFAFGVVMLAKVLRRGAGAETKGSVTAA